MNKIKLVAIDLAKRCYQVGAFDQHGKLLYNRKYSPTRFALAMQQLEPTVVRYDRPELREAKVLQSSA